MAREAILFSVAGFFLGVLLRSFFVLDLAFGALILFLGIIFFAFFYFKKTSLFILYLATVFIGIALGLFRYEFQDRHDNLVELYEKVGSEVKLEGIIVDDPKIGEKFTSAVFKTDGKKILLTLPHYPETRYGDQLEIEGKLVEPENASDFDWGAYLAKDNIYFEMFLPKVLSRSPGGGELLVGRIKSFLFSLRSKFVYNLSRTLPEPHASFLAGLTIGDRTSLPGELKEEFRRVGVIHLVVLSGYNVSIIGDNILKALSFLPVFPLFRIGLAALGIILFAVMTGASATIVRAAIMTILLLFARSTGKIYQALSALLAAAFLMLLVNPKILRFDTSFQLSFLATLSLIIFLPKIEKYFSWVPASYGLREAFLATISTQAFVLPLLMASSGYISVVSIPANVLILGFVPITMFLGFLTGLGGFILPFFGQLFSYPTYWLLHWELGVVNFLSKFNFSIFEISGISVWLVTLMYFALAFLLYYLGPKSNEAKI